KCEMPAVVADIDRQLRLIGTGPLEPPWDNVHALNEVQRVHANELFPPRPTPMSRLIAAPNQSVVMGCQYTLCETLDAPSLELKGHLVIRRRIGIEYEQRRSASRASA